MKLSVIIPVFNEEKTIAQILHKVMQITIPDTRVEIIIVNDASTDMTEKEIEKLVKEHTAIKMFSHTKNLGKGAAIKTGIQHATGEYIIIQDADLEYNPEDIKKLTQALESKKTQVVYGTRLKRFPHITKEEKSIVFLLHFFGNRFLSLVTSFLYGQWITDMETCYKLIPQHALKNIALRENGFAFEPEITAKLMKKGFRIKEVAITTKPRGYNEGKKLHAFREGPLALWTLIKYKFSN